MHHDDRPTDDRSTDDAGSSDRTGSAELRGSTPAAAQGPTGAVIFMTGLSGAGKSTIAEALAASLRADGREVTILDGDELRKHLSADLGFDAASREANVRRAAEIAARLAAEGQIVICALIAPFERSRAEARSIVEPVAPFHLVWVRTPLEVAEQRDPKGLYKRVRAGELRDFTGIDSPFEEPMSSDVVIETVAVSVDESVQALRGLLGAIPR